MQPENQSTKPETKEETADDFPEASCYALLPGLIENLTLWAKAYRGKPISLSLFRAVTILGIIESANASQWTVNRKMHCKRKYEIWAGENITEEDAEWATTGNDDRSGLHNERIKAFFAGYISKHNSKVGSE